MAAALKCEDCNRGGGGVIERDTQPRSGGEARRGDGVRCGGGRKRGKKARCFRVQPAAAAASVGDRGRGVGRQPLPLWKPFLFGCNTTRPKF